jgi:hypothetical protein
VNPDSAPLQFTQLAYAALGDSYLAGDGAGSYLTGQGPADGGCIRSHAAYGNRVDAALGGTHATTSGSPFEFVACSGATTIDFEESQQLSGGKSVPPQLNALRQVKGNVGLVTLTIGGNDVGFASNDVGFASIVKACGFGIRVQGTCEAALGSKVNKALAELKTDLVILFLEISKARGLASNARVAVVGYPLPFDPQVLKEKSPPSCRTGFLNVTYKDSDMIWINNVVTSLDRYLSEAAAVVGFTYVNDLAAYQGHYLCETTPYINGAVAADNGVTSFHPKATGQTAIAAKVEKALGLG